MPRRPSISTRQRRHEPKGSSESVAQSFGIFVPSDIAAAITEVPVGTVDNFQGKEAVISITSLAASNGRDAPRGPEFLLLQNRLNVAISRAQVAAYLVYSPGLLDDLPRTPEGVARLSAFAQLVQG